MKVKLNLFLALFLTSFVTYAQLPLSGKWSYTFNDDKANSLIDTDDSRWSIKESNNLKWNQELTGKGNIIWVRKTVIISSSLKKQLKKTGSLMVFFGRIKQEDKFYFNGKFVGATNSGDIKRAYLLEEKDILWDKKNTFAIRISHWGSSSAIEGDPYVTGAKPAQLFFIHAGAKGVTHKQQVKNIAAVYTNKIKNNGLRTVNAVLTANFYDIDHNKLKSFQRNIVIKPGDNTYSFPYQSPTDFLKIQYSMSIPLYNYKAVWNDMFGYNDIDYHPAKSIVAYRANEVFSPAQLGQQNVKGWLGERLKVNMEQRLYKVDEVALLAGFVNKPGIHPWIGEHVGKFLEAACNAYQYSKDPALKIQIDRIAQQLIAAQLSDGYLGTYDKDSQWTSWDVWSHKYDLVGLLSYYELTGYKPALAASEKIGNLLYTRFGDKPGQLDIIKSGAHVGMAATSIIDPMTDLYRNSGKKEYLDFCYYITRSYNTKNGPKIIATLDSVGRVDKTANAKAYEMMSNLVGLVKLYRVTADKQFLRPVLAAWKDIKDNRLYITGTTSSFEHFHGDHLLPASSKDNMGEGCVTTTWVQLNFQLLSLFGKMEYVDELERAVYNHLTGAENPQTGCVSYYTPLMGAKPYGCNITCCMSSIPRGIAMIPMFANGEINESPSFLFYQPGIYKTELSSKTKVEFITKTTFPEKGNAIIEVNPALSENFEVILRKPYWAGNFNVAVNGKAQKTGDADTIAIKRVWTKGDKIEIGYSLPITTLDGGKSYPGSIALQRGPQVLVVDKNLNPALEDEFRMSSENVEMTDAGVSLPVGWVGKQAYQFTAESKGENKQIVLVPYADASQTGGTVTTWLKKK